MTSIATAAIRARDGTVWTLPRPARHQDIIRLMGERPNHSVADTYDQGFVTDGGRFVDRHEAMAIARAAGQLLGERVGPDGIRVVVAPGGRLYSEDIF